MLRPDIAAPGAAVEATRRCGPKDEVDAAVRWLAALRARDHPWREMALVVPGKRKWRDPVAASLAATMVPHRMLIGHPDAVPDFSDEVLHAMSLYTAAACGPFIALAIVGLGDLPWKQQTLDEAAAVVATAIGRATARLSISWSSPSPLVDRMLAD